MKWGGSKQPQTINIKYDDYPVTYDLAGFKKIIQITHSRGDPPLFILRYRSFRMTSLKNRIYSYRFLI